MTRARPSPLLPLLAIVALAFSALAGAACQTARKPLTGFDKQPPGLLLDGTSRMLIWPLFELPQQPAQIFRLRFNGQDAVILTSDEGFYDYAKLSLQGWTEGWAPWVTGIPPGTYTLELVDSAGQSWGQSAPFAIPADLDFENPTTQFPAVVFAHYQGQSGVWTMDPTLQDADTATDEITVTNLTNDDVVVQRCLIADAVQTSCAPVGTVAPGADLLTVETMAASLTGDHQALVMHLAGDASHSYQRDLIQRGGSFGASCQIERIIVHGRLAAYPYSQDVFTGVAMSSCYGTATGAN
jgi:hypothetical protein